MLGFRNLCSCIYLGICEEIWTDVFLLLSEVNIFTNKHTILVIWRRGSSHCQVHNIASGQNNLRTLQLKILNIASGSSLNLYTYNSVLKVSRAGEQTQVKINRKHYLHGSFETNFFEIDILMKVITKQSNLLKKSE